MARKSRFQSQLQQQAQAQRVSQLAEGYMHTSMRSSWIEYYEWIPYDPRGMIGDFHMQVKGGKKYTWKQVSRDQAGQAIGGNASCQTDDPTGKLRWYVGKHPSLGASYHQICKFFTQAGIPSTTPLPSASYFDIATEGYKSMYAVTSIKRGRGRPTRAEERAKFGWAGRYA